MNKWLTSAIGAKILGFSQAYIRRLCGTGKIKAEKKGRDWVFPESSIKNITRKRKEKVKEE